MNHYACLKIAQDAPPEVVRAAYRALASPLHPAGPDDADYARLMALNAAYETLIDPLLRAAYDATLTPATPRVEPPQVELPPPETPVSSGGRPSRRALGLGGGALVLALGIAVWVGQLVSSHQMERALSDQYAAHPASVPAESAPPPLAPASPGATTDIAAHRPTVDELSRLSDEELLKVLPSLDAAEPTPAPRGRTGLLAPHPLDGSPMRLRTEGQLVDPLAPEPAASRRP